MTAVSPPYTRLPKSLQEQPQTQFVAAPPPSAKQSPSQSAGRSPTRDSSASGPEEASAKTAAIVSLKQVCKTYGNGCQALHDINLTIGRGDFLYVTGPSGAGKSTLLKLLYGQERPSSGEVWVNGRDLARLHGNKLALLRRRIGVVFQDYKLIPRRTVSENVAFVLWAQGFSRREINRRLIPTLKMVGLQHKANCFPEQLSGGEQQRVSIARAVVGTPPLLLADEPTGNLDADNSWQVVKILQKLNSIGITVVLTTHDESLVRASNDPVVQIQDGGLRYVRR